MHQKLKPVEQPQQLKKDLHEKIWLVRNVPAYILDAPLPVRSLIHEELPGYVDFLGVKRIEGDYFARIAATAFRDQSDFIFAEYEGSLWSLHNNFLFSLADDFKSIQKGFFYPMGRIAANVRIGRDGFNKWLKTENDLVLRFQKPEGGRVIVTSLADTLYDSVVDCGSVYVPEGSFLFFAGAPGDRFRVYVD